MTGRTADYVVVGGGSAGCVLAARLSEDPDVTVHLVEEGPPDRSLWLHLPVTFYKTSQGSHVRRYAWEPPEGHGGAPAPTMVQARVLGGGSSVNAMVYVRGQPADYDAWAAAGAEGWGWRDVLPYFRRCEGNDRLAGEAHGTDGPLPVSDQTHTHPLTRAWVRAAQGAGLPYNADFNGGRQDGVGFYQINARAGRRGSASVSYLRPARGRPNLRVETGTRAVRVLVERGRAVGVEVVRRGRARALRAAREVILSAGAINTPRLLMVSGIGPADHLRGVGVPVAADLPGVGGNFQDHVEVSIIHELDGPHSYDRYKRAGWQAWAGLQYALFRSGPVTSNIVEGGAFWRSPLAEDRADVQYCFMPGAGVEDGVGTVPGGHGSTLNVCQTRPRSVGEVRLRDAGPLSPPVIRPRYLTDPFDVEVLAHGVAFGREVMAAAPIARFVRREHVPATPPRGMDDLRAFVRREAHAALHPVGTCRMGRDDLAVTGPDLRVRGVEGLRVADASVMPNLCSGNTNAAAIMIGEKAADLVQGRTGGDPAA